MILIIHNIRKRVKYCVEKLRKEDAQKKKKKHTGLEQHERE